MDVSIVTTLITAIAVLLASLIPHIVTLRKERLHQEFEREKSYRERLNEVYLNCLSSLSKVIIHRSAFNKLWALKNSSSSDEHQKFEADYLKEIVPVYEEARRWLEALLIYYPNKQGKDFEIFEKKVKGFSVSTNDNEIENLRSLIFQLETSDGILQSLLSDNSANKKLKSLLQQEGRALKEKNR